VTFGCALKASIPDLQLKAITSSRDFLDAFLPEFWMGRKFVLLVDEFSELHRATPEVLNEVVRTFREIRNNRSTYAIQSIIACGTFSVLRLSATDRNISPFNVADHIQNSYFSIQQTQQLFSEFEQDSSITIDAEVVKDIWLQSGGCVIRLWALDN
jgi:hypothetical protein